MVARLSGRAKRPYSVLFGFNTVKPQKCRVSPLQGIMVDIPRQLLGPPKLVLRTAFGKFQWWSFMRGTMGLENEVTSYSDIFITDYSVKIMGRFLELQYLDK